MMIVVPYHPMPGPLLNALCEPAVTGWPPSPAGLLSLTSQPFLRVSVRSGGLPIPPSLLVLLRRDLCGSFVFLLLITLFFEDEVECGWFEGSCGFENNIS